MIVATIYKLSYTAEEIDEKLGKVDENTTNINQLQEEIVQLQINGLTTEQAKALNNMFKKCAFTEDVSADYAAFRAAFGITDDVKVYTLTGNDLSHGGISGAYADTGYINTAQTRSSKVSLDYPVRGGDIVKITAISVSGTPLMVATGFLNYAAVNVFGTGGLTTVLPDVSDISTTTPTHRSGSWEPSGSEIVAPIGSAYLTISIKKDDTSTILPSEVESVVIEITSEV